MNILEKYNLSEYLHTYITDYTLPTTAVWKSTGKIVLYQHQSKSFQEVVTSDSEFVRFKKIHNVIKPSVIWQAPSTPAELELMHFIIKCSVLIPRKSSEICQNCGFAFTDPLKNIMHIEINRSNSSGIIWSTRFFQTAVYSCPVSTMKNSYIFY